MPSLPDETLWSVVYGPMRFFVAHARIPLIAFRLGLHEHTDIKVCISLAIQGNWKVLESSVIDRA
jgi:hypothetical protein